MANLWLQGGKEVKLRSKAPVLREWKGTALISTDPSVCSGRSAVLVIDGPTGGPLEPAEAYTYGYEILEATDEEIEKLHEAGYSIPYIGR
jgi:hypothetical protein